MTTAYTDGACLGNPGPGGWAWAIPGGAFASGADPATTNQRMEVQAALEAARSIAGPLHIVSDSTYVVKCFNDRWFEGWQRRGWKNASKQPVANQDLWRPFIDLFLERNGEITFEWVKGHSGDVMNDVVDRLATEAARVQQPRSGDSPPDALGEPDSLGEPDRMGPDRMEPDRMESGLLEPVVPASPSKLGGYKVAIFGHRPPDLGGYDPANPVAKTVTNTMTDVLAGWAAINDDLVVLTGLGLGAEQLGAEAASAAGLGYVAVLAHPDPDRVWPTASRSRYAELVRGASSVITLDPTSPATRQEAGKAAGRRDAWLTGMADAAVVVWNGADRALRDTVAALERREVDVFVITPAQ